MTADKITRELWWTNQELSSADTFQLGFSMFTDHLEDGGRSSET
jgi:hypothetical protein